MQTSLLPGAEKVYTGNLATVEEDQRAVGSLPIVSLALLALALVAIGVGSVIMYGRTNRQFNIGLVVAAATVLLVIGWVVVATQLAAAEIERSRTEGSERFEQLAKARILAQKARTDETLELIAPERHHRRRKVVLRPHRRAGQAARRGACGRDGRCPEMDRQPPKAGRGLRGRRLSRRGRPGDRPRSGRFGSAVRRRRIQLARRDRANARNAARSSVRGGCVAGMESHGDACADGRRCGGGRRRVVAAAQGVPVRTRVVVALLARCAHRRRMWILRRRRYRCRSRRSNRGHPVRRKSRPRRSRRNADCDREASLRPGPLPSPGAMPPGSTMAAIAERGRLIVGVDQNTYLFGFRNPATGPAGGLRHRHRPRDRARHLRRSGPHRCCGWSMRANGNRRCSPVRWTWWSGPTRSPVTASKTSHSPRCTSTPTRSILAVKGSGIDSAAALSGKRVCAVSGTTSLSKLFELNPRPTLFGVTTWTDCLVMLQQGQVDAISTDDVVLYGLATAGPERGGGRRQHRRRALRHRGQEGEHRPGSIRQRCPRPDARRRNVAAALRGPAARASDHPQVRRHHATRTDHEGADHRRDRSRTRVAHKGSRCDVGDADRAGEPPRTRARASLSTDRRDSATVDGDREVPRAAVGGLGADDVDSGLGADGAGAPIEASTTTTAAS